MGVARSPPVPSRGDAQPGPHSTCPAAVEVIIRWCHTAVGFHKHHKSDMSPPRGPRRVNGGPQWTLAHRLSAGTTRSFAFPANDGVVTPNDDLDGAGPCACGPAWHHLDTALRAAEQPDRAAEGRADEETIEVRRPAQLHRSGSNPHANRNHDRPPEQPPISASDRGQHDQPQAARTAMTSANSHDRPRPPQVPDAPPLPVADGNVRGRACRRGGREAAPRWWGQ